MVETISIKKFDPRTMSPSCVAAFNGRRGSGKTWGLRDIVYNFRWMRDGIVFCPTDEGNRDWDGHFPSAFIYPDYDPIAAKRLLERQRKRARLHRKNPDAYPDPRDDPTMIICDDCMFDRKKFITDPSVMGILKCGRHWGIAMFITTQYVMDIPRDLRTQFDYIFLFKDNDMGNRERIWKAWCGVVPTFEAFNAIFSQLTRDNGCLVVDNSSLSDRIEDCLFWYKAKDRTEHPRFKVGCKAFWLYHYANVQDDFDDDGDGTVAAPPKRRYRVKKMR